jgi:hypothetical protein
MYLSKIAYLERSLFESGIHTLMFVKNTPMLRFPKQVKEEIHWFKDKECKQRDYLFEYRAYGRVPHHLYTLRGGMNGYVIKHLHRSRKGRRKKVKVILTKFPDMSRVVASPKQRQQRNLFKEAEAFAKKVIAHPELKQAWHQYYSLRRKRVYTHAIRLYMQYLKYKNGIPPQLFPKESEEQAPIAPLISRKPVLPIRVTYPSAHRAIKQLIVREALSLTG